MDENTNRLELFWVDKYKEIKLEPRILIEDREKSYGDAEAENMLIHGDNLLALKALEQKFTGMIKCIYIDPPYNTGNAFDHYDDNLEHSTWLSLMKPRLEIMKKLLRSDGFICCHIDDSEGHYLKVLMDEVFGRSNYMTTLYVRVRYPDKTLKSDMDYHKEIEQIHVYRKAYGAKPIRNKEEVGFDKFNFYINEKSSGKEITLGNKKVVVFEKDQYEIVKKDGSEYGLKEIWASGSILDGNSSGRFFRDYLTGRYEEDGYGVLYKVFGIGDDRFDYRYFTGPNRVGATKGKYYQGVPVNQLNSSENYRETPINSFYDMAASFGNCRTEGGVGFRSGKKPEAVLEIIMKHFSNEGDFVLDSFLGSGSTASVAHKMNRKWIGIELGEHCFTHCIPRLQSAIDGKDNTGISKEVKWQGGGGFKFYELAPSLLKKDKFGNLVIDERYNNEMLAAAMCKQEGFTYKPDSEVFWKQGYSYENDFIFTTTNLITPEYIDGIYNEMKQDESLLICCKAYQASCEGRYSSINIKKIPQMLFGRCEFGKDNYDLNIVELPDLEDVEEEGLEDE